MKEIQLTKGIICFVDDEDFERVNQYKWYASEVGRSRKIYAKRKIWIHDNEIKKKIGKYFYNGFYRIVAMHRFVLDAPTDKEVDHIDGNGLNNCKSNLRLCTRQENAMNTKKRNDNTSGITGIIWNKDNKNWRARIYFKNKKYELGSFKNKEDAIKARFLKQKELFGIFSHL